MKRSGTSEKQNLINKLASDSSISPNYQPSEIPSKKNQFEWMKKFPVLIFAFFVIMGLTTCENDEPEPDDILDEYCSTPLEVLLKEESNNVANALTAYLNDFTVTNCNAYKAAYNEYLDSLYFYQERCAFVITDLARARMEDAIQDAESEINGLDCE